MSSQQNRRGRRAPLEMLESRMVPASLAPRAAVGEALSLPRAIPGNFTGTRKGVTSSSFRIAPLSGSLGKLKFNSGSGSGEYSGMQFTGGTFLIRNRRGSVVATLDAATIRPIAGQKLRFTANATISGATGRYDPVEGSTGQAVVSFARTLRGTVQVRLSLTRFSQAAVEQLGY